MEGYRKDFEEWNGLKKVVDGLDFFLPFNEREIWWVSFGVNVGIEIDGKGKDFERPAIIVKKYNKEHMWIVPINSSTIIKEGINMAIYHSGLAQNSVASISQLQSKSSRRLTSYIGTISILQFIKIVEAIHESLPKYTKDLA